MMNPHDPQPDAPPPAAPRPGGDFVVQLTSSQRMLYAYIVTVLGGTDAAEDVLQTVNLKAWEKAEQFTAGTDFGAWVRRIAQLTIHEHWRKTRRGREAEHRLRLMEKIDAHFDENGAELEDRQSALAYCLRLLPDHHRRWIESRYRDNQAVNEIAEARGCSAGAVAQALFRVRQVLKRCIDKRLAAEGGGGASWLSMETVCGSYCCVKRPGR